MGCYITEVDVLFVVRRNMFFDINKASCRNGKAGFFANLTHKCLFGGLLVIYAASHQSKILAAIFVAVHNQHIAFFNDDCPGRFSHRCSIPYVLPSGRGQLAAIFIDMTEAKPQITEEEFVAIYGKRPSQFGGKAIPLSVALQMEAMFCEASSDAREDPAARLGFLAARLLEAGSLLPEHHYLLPDDSNTE